MTDSAQIYASFVALAVIFAFGAAMIFLIGLIPSLRKVAGELWGLYATEFIIVAGIVSPAVFGGWIFIIALVLFALRSQREVFLLFDLPAQNAAEILAMAAGLTMIAATMVAYSPVTWMAIAALCGLIGLTFAAMRGRGMAIATLFYPVAFVIAIAGLRMMDHGYAWILVVYGTVEIADASALVFGKAFGRTAVLPHLSPRKTVEGLLCGFLIGGCAGFLLARYMLPLPIVSAVLVVLVALISGLAGDLLTSWLKRKRGKKDFAPVMRQHGGILDIYDSFLLAGPAVYLLLLAKLLR